jgi:CheY-like chemotaxis protein
MSSKLKKRVLILDDEPDSVSLLRLRLESEGYSIYAGLDGLEGLVKLRKQLPDLIIMDVVMPKLDGVEFFKTIKQYEDYSMIPIIVVTGKRELRDTFVSLGCDYFAVKPFNAGEVVQVAKELIKQKVLAMGDYKDFQQHIRSGFPEDDYRLNYVNNVSELFMALAEKRYHYGIVRLAQVEIDPVQFMRKVRNVSLNSRVRMMVYCDAYVKGTENGDEVAIANLEVNWLRAGDVIFYDSRVHDHSLVEFMSDYK